MNKFVREKMFKIFFVFLILALTFASDDISQSAEFIEVKMCSRLLCQRDTACITIFQKPNQNGVHECLQFKNIECVNLKPWWFLGGSSRVSSINKLDMFLDSCVRFYDKADCEGDSIEINDNGHTNLKKYNFDDRAMSASSCHRGAKGSDFEFQKCESNCPEGLSACITLYESTFFRGNHQCIKFKKDECISLSSWWKETLPEVKKMGDHFSKVLSANSYNTCVRFYKGNDCTGTSFNITGEVQNMKLHQAKSVSSCIRVEDKLALKDEMEFSENSKGKQKIRSLENSDKLVGAESIACVVKGSRLCKILCTVLLIVLISIFF